MGRVRIYVATSADGFIASPDGSVDFLDGHDPRAYGYDRFYADVATVIMGRRTFEHVRTFAEDWPYAGKRCWVFASHPVGRVPGADVAVSKVTLAETVATARAAGKGDIWIVGGAVMMRTALEQRLVDLVEIFYIPVFLGSGIPLLGHVRRSVRLALNGIETYPDGVVKLAYTPTKEPRRNA